MNQTATPLAGLEHWEAQRREWMQGLPHSKLVLDTDEPVIDHDHCTDTDNDTNHLSSASSSASAPQLRKFIPENYGVIYDHLIRHRLIVHGWKRDGLWMEAAAASEAALPMPQPTFGSPPPDTANCISPMSLSTFRVVGDTLVTTDATPAPPPLPSAQAIRDIEHYSKSAHR
ncbi:hypothetical protein BDF22DRAFT_744075 [Syncephalis plumigaleata]|nr:hypothetical protein BDF22DRAFT_744075 [Syncephalis plumigaleata]